MMSVRVAAAIMAMVFCATSYATEKNDAMSLFWSQFRQAVIAGENNKVATMTDFPFSVYGIFDSDPVLQYDKKSFPAVLGRLLDQEVFSFAGDKVITKTMREVIVEKKKVAEKDYLTPTVVRVEALQFEKIKGNWRLTRGYLEE